jgi:hypothetical protein
MMPTSDQSAASRHGRIAGDAPRRRGRKIRDAESSDLRLVHSLLAQVRHTPARASRVAGAPAGDSTVRRAITGEGRTLADSAPQRNSGAAS